MNKIIKKEVNKIIERKIGMLNEKNNLAFEIRNILAGKIKNNIKDKSLEMVLRGIIFGDNKIDWNNAKDLIKKYMPKEWNTIG